MSADCCGDTCSTAETRVAGSRTMTMLAGPGITLVVGGLAIGAGFVLARAGADGLALGAYLVSLIFTLPRPARQAWTAVGTRVLDIHVLMVVAVVGAAALGEWLEAAAVVWLFGVAGWLERESQQRARRAIHSLMALEPAMAVVRVAGVEQSVPVDTIRPGALVVLPPGARVPVDGTVVAGQSALDQSSITGEAWPIECAVGDRVLAGAINGSGALEIEATRPAAESTLARIVHLVEQAQRQRAPVHHFVDRFARVYTPAVVALAAVLAVVPPLLLGAPGDLGAAFGVWGYRALALLVVACPCALVISTPVSVVSALAAAARHGVLVKSGAALERLGTIRCVAFDKTGTLTDGRVRVTDVVGVNGVSADGVLSVAASLESRSEHPIGRAIVDRARRAGLAVLPGLGFRALPGFGAEATVAALPAVIGSHRLFEERQLCTPDLHDRLGEVHERGATPVLVGHAGSALGVIGLTHDVRPGGPTAVGELRRAGIQRVVMLTGDSTEGAAALCERLDLDEAHAALLPADKVAELGRLRSTWGPVAMVGDGVNDAPALAAADVGIAMGAAGTDVALETADVALMSDDLARLPYAVRLARRTIVNIRANVTVALALKLAFVGLAAAGMATIWMAVLADTGATLLVTGNALRLLRVKPA